jgi:uncharacterized protein with von Willebrand factor type A (vWA) domain
MSINTTGSNYMSNTSILEWMELKTETLYGKMKTAMDQSNHRVAAEDALNDIKAKVDDLKASGADAAELRQSINDTIAKYGAEFPEVGEVLQPIADELSKRYEVAPRVRQQIPSNNLPGTRSGNMAVSSGSAPTGPGKLTPPLQGRHSGQTRSTRADLHTGLQFPAQSNQGHGFRADGRGR